MTRLRGGGAKFNGSLLRFSRSGSSMRMKGRDRGVCDGIRGEGGVRDRRRQTRTVAIRSDHMRNSEILTVTNAYRSNLKRLDAIRT